MCQLCTPHSSVPEDRFSNTPEDAGRYEQMRSQSSDDWPTKRELEEEARG